MLLELYEERSDLIDGVGPWTWIKTDDGLWDGPSKDWENSHKAKLEKYCRGFDTVVQAGGGMGMYPRLLSRMFKWVYTFEPDVNNFYCLVNNCGNDNIIKMQAALGEDHRLVTILNPSTSNCGTHRVQGHDDARIPQLCIDDLDLRAIDLIMLDVEGYELNVLKGAEKAIKRFKPTIQAECGSRVEDYLKDLNYRFVETSVADWIFVPN